MHSQSSTDMEYEQIQQLAEQGQYAQALEQIERFIESHPDDAQAINDCGVLLFTLGRSDEAVDRLEEALTLQSPPDPATLVNLAEAVIAARRGELTVELMPRLMAADVFTPDLGARAATALLDSGQLAGAIEVLLLSQQAVPGQQVIEPMLDSIRARRPKVALVGRPDQQAMLEPHRQLLAPRFNVGLETGEDPAELERLLSWCDVIVTTDNPLDLSSWIDRPQINISAGGLSPAEVHDQILAIETGQQRPREADTGLRLA